MVVGRKKPPNSCRNRSNSSPLWGESLPKSGNFQLFGAAVYSRAPIGVKFRTTKQTHVLLGCTKFHTNRCNVSPLRGKNADLT